MTLPAGLLNNDIEIYNTDMGAKVLQNGNSVPYLSMPDMFRQPYQTELIRDKKACQALRSVFHLTSGDEMEEQFVACRFGGALDQTPDLIDMQPVPDCPLCKKLKTCEAFDIVCKAPLTKSGKRLARHEYLVVIEVAKGKQDSEIAELLKIEVSSVRTFLARAREKMCLNNRVEVALWLINKGIV